MMAGPAHSGEPKDSDPTALEVPAAAGVLRALVVDDHTDIRELLRIQLDEQPDVTVVGVASDGVEAIAMAEELQPDVLLLDLGMPRLSGLEALPRLREVSPLTKIVAISGFEEGSQARDARAAGVDAYVEKGLNMGLVDVIRAVCASDDVADLDPA